MNNKNIGLNFKAVREKLGYSQEQISDFLYLKNEFLNDFEDGKTSIGVSVLERACNLFGCTIVDLENGTMKCKSYTFDEIKPCEYPKELLKSIHDVNRIALNIRRMKELEKCAI